MPITLLDIILLGVMLISGLLAMVRGFIREILSIAAWGAAALLTVIGFPKLLPVVQQYVAQDIVAKGITVAGIFLGTLLIVSIITVKISDRILDSRIGALDRTMGFLFGLARGLIIVVVAFLFFDWLVQPPEKQPDWVRNAKSRVILQSAGETLKSMLPDDPESYLRKLKKPRGEEQQEPADTPPPGTKSERDGGDQTGSIKAPDEQPGYGRSDRVEMQQLLQSSAPKTR
jgi:membrane protein required for colicin V production